MSLIALRKAAPLEERSKSAPEPNSSPKRLASFTASSDNSTSNSSSWSTSRLPSAGIRRRAGVASASAAVPDRPAREASSWSTSRLPSAGIRRRAGVASASAAVPDRPAREESGGFPSAATVLALEAPGRRASRSRAAAATGYPSPSPSQASLTEQLLTRTKPSFPARRGDRLSRAALLGAAASDGGTIRFPATHSVANLGTWSLRGAASAAAVPPDLRRATGASERKPA
mmetsp:Transcript_80471/g.260092  ORF Transcript_80471/g.260092 Transcript_80471/m.260092 type:complete len:230 (-) Transcript_80471:497-1186(-)